MSAPSIPVVVVGGGAAGLMAALAAREAGQDVLVLERDPVPRGSTALSAGLVPAAGTRWQAAAAVEDSPAQFADDVMAKSGGAADPVLVAAVTAGAGPALEWLHERHGLDFSLITDFRYPGHSALRMHGLPTRSGAELVDRLRTAAEAADVTILCDAQVTARAVEDGAVRGVRFRRPDGAADAVGCHAVVLACNGYGGDPGLVRAHVPEMADALYFGHPGNQGDALRWGEALGAGVRDLSGYQGHGSVAHPAGILITWATVTEGGFQVNRDGLRFANEARGYSEAAADVLRQPDAVAWTVFDERIAHVARQFEDFRQAERMQAVLGADTVDELAARMGVPPAALSAAFDDVASCKAQGATDRHGRDFAGVAPLRPPFRAVRVTGALFHTQGGLVVDAHARVLRSDGAVIDGLYAAGGAAVGVSGPRAEGYLSGNGLLTAIVLGRIAGAHAAGSIASVSRHA